jgi:hypothetical protein
MYPDPDKARAAIAKLIADAGRTLRAINERDPKTLRHCYTHHSLKHGGFSADLELDSFIADLEDSLKQADTTTPDTQQETA